MILMRSFILTRRVGQSDLTTIALSKGELQRPFDSVC